MPTKGQFTDADLVQTSPTGTAEPTTTQGEQPSMLHAIGKGIGDLALGAGRGLYSTLSAPAAFAAEQLQKHPIKGIAVDPARLAQRQTISTPVGTVQSIGKGIEQAGEFMVPGAAEEKIAGLAPKAVRPLAKIGASALGSGAVNAAQGGGFGTGAALGAGGAAIGQAAHAAAPAIAEKALGIRGKFDRAFNKTPGIAALEETTAIRPETIANQAKTRIGELSQKTEELANKASVRPNPIRGLLQPPAREIPLAPTPSPRNPRMRPMAFDAQVNPEEPLEPRSGNPMAPISEYPGVNPHYLSGSAHPELSGRIPTTQGVLIRPGEVQHGALPSTVPNRMASLAPARSEIAAAQNTAIRQNAAGTHGQLQGMADTLGRRFDTGQPIPENVTPRELLDLRRGFNEEHGRWNPDLHEPTVAASRRAYGGLTGEFHRVLPEAAPLDERISSLIPVKNRAQITSLGDNPLQKGLARFGAHTGALTLGGLGAVQGGRERGLPGAVMGGLTGVLAPELIASPEGQMIAARALRNAGALRPAVGAAAQLTKRKEDEK